MELSDQKKLLLGLKKSIGIINKTMKMIEDDAYCVDIASQVNAAIGLLKSANTTLLANHLSCCGPKFLNAAEKGRKDEFIKELIRAWNVSNK